MFWLFNYTIFNFFNNNSNNNLRREGYMHSWQHLELTIYIWLRNLGRKFYLLFLCYASHLFFYFEPQLYLQYFVSQHKKLSEFLCRATEADLGMKIMEAPSARKAFSVIWNLATSKEHFEGGMAGQKCLLK